MLGAPKTHYENTLRNTLQKHITKTHYKNTLRKHITKTHYETHYETHITKTHYENTLQKHITKHITSPAGSVGRDLNLQKLNYQYLTTSVVVVLVVR